ncbi:hypothetical protein [Chitinivibrio alkaliphilus]|uniref:DUF3098 domain-containing protein n=1 Tax=Chitinivibrio alkaliphilus ACht1 TaxID=1313304 RepID=U7D8Z1_9BACT|nr:hypothetical protein [Chitinivibrio alkaliphilus]ERP30860.1 hypothetical protein CALK_2311 [Chitinivibrio alkaliphilus ACht1]
MSKRPLFHTPLFILSLLVAVAGYILLGTGEVDGIYSLTLAPVLLVIAYAVLFPLTVLLQREEKK